MRITPIYLLLYGLLLVVGGFIGFLTAGSLMSLLIALPSGLLIIWSASLLNKGERRGKVFALILSLALALFFSYRFANAMHFMPGGLFSLLSYLAVLLIMLDKPSRQS